MEDIKEEVEYHKENCDIKTDDSQDYKDIVIEIYDKILKFISSFNIVPFYHWKF